MKKSALIILFILASLSQGIAALNAYFSYGIFDNPGSNPYIETYLTIIGNSVKSMPSSSGKSQGTLEVQWIYRKGDSIVYHDKYNLLGPETELAEQAQKDFIDQQRVSLKPGDYQLELRISDKNTADAPYVLNQKIELRFPDAQVHLSDIELIESYARSDVADKFSKNGYRLVPYILGFYPKEISRISFYAEMYAPGDWKDTFLVRYFISNDDNKQVIKELGGVKKQAPAAINALLAEFPLENLSSGNYTLNVELRDKKNHVLASRHATFQRLNKIPPQIRLEENYLVNVDNTFVQSFDNPDTLVDYLSCIYPISTRMENQMIENQVRIKDVHSMQQIFYSFWLKRDPLQPELAWMKYKEEVEKVNASYRDVIHKGYETDRGRVYLQYGPPNAVVAEKSDPESYPYEIWQYYTLGNQQNRKFVFYSTNLAANDYRLMHSDATGELQDPGWELKLHSRSQQFGSDFDEQNSIDIYGSKTKENFSNPK